MKKILFIILFSSVLFAGCSGKGSSSKTPNVDNNPLSPDTSPPTINSVSALSDKKIKLVFSEQVDKISAETYSNFILTSDTVSLPVETVSLEDDNQSVIITLSQSMNYNVNYHCFVINVKDLNENVMTGSSHDFTGRGIVKAELLNLPEYNTNSTAVSIKVSGNDIVNYKYRINNGSWSSNTNVSENIIESGLSERSYLLEVIASDSLGNWQPENAPTVFNWIVDLTPPVATFENLPANVTSSNSIDVIVNGVVEYKYKIDGEDWSEIRNGKINRTDLSDANHTLQVIGKDIAGNWQADSGASSYSWTVDTSQPVAVLSGRPNVLTNMTNANIFVSGNGVTAYKYKIDGSSWSSETDTSLSIPLSSLSEGSHTITVIGKNAAQTWQEITSATSYSWYIDITPPVAAILSVPASPSSVISPSIQVGGADVTWYKYKLDENTWSALLPVSEITTLPNLSEGSHTIKVIGSDAANNLQAESSAAEYTWSVDLTPPVASFDAASLPASLTNSQTESIIVSPAGIVAYKYQIDNSGWSETRDISDNELSFNNSVLDENSHILKIIGKDAAGNWQSSDNATAYSWTIDITPPLVTLMNTPDNPTSSNNASITISGTDAVSYIYSLDGGSWYSKSITDALVLSGLSEFSHTLNVKGIDAAGNIQTNAVSYSWVVDQTASNAVLSNLPQALTNQTAASINVGGSDVVAYKYNIDNSGWSSEKSSSTALNLSSLTEGSHSLKVIAKDSAGNWQETSSATPYSWTVDITPPEVILSGYPASVTNNAAVNMDISGTDVTGYMYQINGGVWSNEYTSDINISLNLPEGTHNFKVIGKDSAGNWQQINASTNVTVQIDLSAPSTVELRDAGSTSQTSNISFDWTGNLDIAAVRIQIATDPSFAADKIVFGGTGGADIANTGSYTYPSSMSNGSTYYARIKVADVAGNWSQFGTHSDGISLVGFVKANVKNTSGQIISGAAVTLKDTSGSVVAALSTDSSGNVVFSDVIVGTNSYILDVTAGSYTGATKNNISVNTGGISDQGIIYLVPVGAASGKFTGRVIDANDGDLIAGATVNFRNWTGDIVNTRTTAADGTFTSSTLTPGTYTVEVSFNGYFSLMVDNLVINGSKNLGDQSICEQLPPYQLRVVLLWGNSPSDYDLHVVGPSNGIVNADTPANNRFHVFWSDQKSFSENTRQYSANADPSGAFATASLVQDATNGYGPEAINLFKLSDSVKYAYGTYTFTVHKWSNDGAWNETPVTIRIYDSEGLWQEIPFPSITTAERYWKVFQVDMQGPSRSDRTLTITNELATLAYGDKASMDWQVAPGGLGGYLLAVGRGDIWAILILLSVVSLIISGIYFLNKKNLRNYLNSKL
ncbi:MAG: carboxypeptidase regulatory-like domain-containing protein [Spirochaetes bacterium]|nr:carboxypeptidase regulatory-like domain-containing protein [Spirochaetota bacterium]